MKKKLFLLSILLVLLAVTVIILRFKYTEKFPFISITFALAKNEIKRIEDPVSNEIVSGSSSPSIIPIGTAVRIIRDVITSEKIVIKDEFTDEQKQRAEKLTSIFENDTTDLQYDYIENLHDGRGYTAGRAGFTSADGDMYDVVKLYTEKVPDNPLSKYLNTLKKLADKESDDTSKLKDFTSAWKKSAEDKKFRDAQDQIVDDLYFEPALDAAKEQGVKSALGKAIFYDTIIQHGGGDDPDSLSGIIKKTNKSVGKSPAKGADEKKWLATFLDTRKKVLEHATDESTREVWAESTERVDILRSILDNGNMNLDGPIEVKTSEHKALIP